MEVVLAMLETPDVEESVSTAIPDIADVENEDVERREVVP